MSRGAAPDLPRFDDWWDYRDAAGTEARFRALLPTAQAAGDPAYLAELLTQIARTEGLQRRFDEALATLDRAGELAASGGRAAVRLALERGRVLNSSGRRDEARPLFLEAWESARAAGEDGLAVDAAHMVAIVEPPESALAWNLTALDLATASADPDARRWAGSLCNNIGWTHHGQGDFETALTFFRRALAQRREAGKEADIRVARWCIARCLRSLGRVQEALDLQLELEAGTSGERAADGYVPEEIAECLLALGRGEEARPYFAAAHALLSQDPWLADAEPERLERLRRLASGDGD